MSRCAARDGIDVELVVALESVPLGFACVVLACGPLGKVTRFELAFRSSSRHRKGMFRPKVQKWLFSTFLAIRDISPGRGTPTSRISQQDS